MDKDAPFEVSHIAGDLVEKIAAIEVENQDLRRRIEELEAQKGTNALTILLKRRVKELEIVADAARPAPEMLRYFVANYRWNDKACHIADAIDAALRVAKLLPEEAKE